MDTDDNFHLQISVPEDDDFIWKDVNISVKNTKLFVDLEYPYCVLHYFTSLLADCFHLISVLLTAALGIQKLLVVAFPLWSRIKLRNRMFIVVCALCFAFSLAINIPKMLLVNITSSNRSTCLISEPNKRLENYVLTIYPLLVSTLLIFAVLTMLVSIYIIVVLCNRKRIRRHSFSSRSEYQSCLLILCVLVVFFNF